MNTQASQTSRRSGWQFSLRSLFLFTTALACMLGLLKMGGRLWSASTVLLLIALLLPVWFPLFFLPAESLWQRLRPLLAVVPAVWYLRLLDIFPFQDSLPWAVLILGYCVAALALAFSARGRRQLINVPLWLALLASAWAILTR
jgi:hypothetical protein